MQPPSDGSRARWRGIEALDAIREDAVSRFQPAWATRAHLLAEAGRASEALEAYERAITLTTDDACRKLLERRRARLPDAVLATPVRAIRVPPASSEPADERC